MYKQSPSRNHHHHRSKGIKVKHILQICALVAVCFWLLYQVKHSHEKRKEFESKDEKVVEKLQSDSELRRFGRKDIPKVTEIATNSETHEEDEDDRDDEEDRENKHEEHETGKEDAIEEERGGDDEIDEHQPEKTEEEDEVDEEKEKEEKGSVTEEKSTENEENEDTHEEEQPEEEEEEKSGKEGHTESEESDDVDKEDHREPEITSDDHDHDHDVESNTRKAQEELYRADDASSEVAHNVQSISQENENITLGQTNQIYGKINFGENRETRTSENVTELVKPEIQSREDVNSTASNATITELKDDKVNLTKADDKSLQNSTLPEIPNNSTVVESLAVSLLSNGTQKALDFNLSQNGTIGIKQASDDKNQQETRESANKSENVNTNKKLASSDPLKDNEAIKDAKDSLVGDESEGKKPEDVGKAGTHEYSESHSSKGKEDTQQDPIDASDTAMIIQEEKDSRKDSDTLPEIKSEVHNTEDAVAE